MQRSKLSCLKWLLNKKLSMQKIRIQLLFPHSSFPVQVISFDTVTISDDINPLNMEHLKLTLSTVLSTGIRCYEFRLL